MKSCTNNFGDTKLSGEVFLGVRAEKRLNTTALRTYSVTENTVTGQAAHLKYLVCDIITYELHKNIGN
jgi:hypothetical protein